MKTIKINLTIAIFLTGYSLIYGQPGGECIHGERYEKLKVRKIAVITEKLNLTVEEAQKFWTVYNEFEAKKNELNKKKKEAFKKFSTSTVELSENELEALAEIMVQSEVDQAALIKEYHNKFKQVLPIKKIITLYHTENQFKRELLKDIRGSKGHRPHQGSAGME